MKKQILSFVLFLTICSRASAAIIYVTESGSGTFDGSSWTNAFSGNLLQNAINSAAVGDEVWVAAGTYYPTTTPDRTIAFSMRNNLTIYGSFIGTESSINERNISSGLTSILSGEIGVAGSIDNSYKVIYNELLNSTAIIDGFIIRDGNDDRNPLSSGNGLGGGIYNHGFNPGGFCHPVIRNCVMTQNTASWGAGAFNNGYNSGNTQPTYINCVFVNNHALIEAGGMDSYAVLGGTASPTVINTIFYENTAATNVGAMYAWGGNGGTCNPVLINCAFINNSALNGYGGAFISDNLDVNGTTSSGSCIVTLQNCIVWNNTATGVSPQFYIRGTGAQVIATHSNIDLNDQVAPHVISGAGTGNMNTSPEFTNISLGEGVDGVWLTADDGLQLLNYSPCIDVGDNTVAHNTDILTNHRIYNTNVDLGAYELNSSPLPIDILIFNVKYLNKKIIINWSTTSEINNDYFTIERSKNGTNWQEIAHIDGAGNSSTLLSYSATDNNPMTGSSYYRLKQTDFDGQFSYSDLRSVSYKPFNSALSVYPNPTKGSLTIELADQDIDAKQFTAKIYTIMGEEIPVSLDFNSTNKIDLNLQGQADGIYFIMMNYNNEVITKKILLIK